MRRYFYFLLVLIFMGCAAVPFKVDKINGVSFVASGNAIDSTHTRPVININANAAAIMPFGFIKDISHPEIIHSSDRQWFGETRAVGRSETAQRHGCRLADDRVDGLLGKGDHSTVSRSQSHSRRLQRFI